MPTSKCPSKIVSQVSFAVGVHFFANFNASNLSDCPEKLFLIILLVIYNDVSHLKAKKFENIIIKQFVLPKSEFLVYFEKVLFVLAKLQRFLLILVEF